MLWRRIIVLTVSLLMLLSSACLAEEDMEFVDANGATGYYVDVASISFESDDIANARIAVIKANQNRRYIYAARFDRQQRTYQLYSSVVQQYDTKAQLENSPITDTPHPYGIASPMKEMVDFIFQYRGQ